MGTLKPSKNGDDPHEGEQRGFSLPIIGLRRHYIFAPAEDITAFELAQILPMLQLAVMAILQRKQEPRADMIYDHLGDAVKRHLKVKELSKIALPPGVES